jgi:hypothetical protein
VHCQYCVVFKHNKVLNYYTIPRFRSQIIVQIKFHKTTLVAGNGMSLGQF